MRKCIMREYVNLPIFFITGIIAFILGQPLLEFLRKIIKQHILAGELLIPLLLWPFLVAIVLYAMKKSFRNAVNGMALAFLASGITYSPTLLINSPISSPYISYLVLLIPVLLPLTFILMSAKYGFVWRATGISYIALILSFFIFFFISAAQHTDILHVQKIEPPTNAINLTGLLDEYPVFKEKLKGEVKNSELGKMELSPDEFFELEEITNNSKFIKINDSYYTIRLSKNMAIRRLITAENYTEVSEEETESYPTVKELINSLEDTLEKIDANDKRLEMIYHASKPSREEVYEVVNFLREYGRSIMYNDRFYEITLDLRVSLNRYEYPPNCPEFTEEELSKYPFLEKAVKEASIKGKAFVETNTLNWRTETGLKEHCIKYRGDYYGIGVMTP